MGDHADLDKQVRIYWRIFFALLVLTVATVGAWKIEFLPDGAAIALALLIATCKASLVALYFMHLRWDRPFNALVFIAALVFLALFLSFAMLDSGEYQRDLIPGYAPAVNQ